jgi:hypothetical protein
MHRRLGTPVLRENAWHKQVCNGALTLKQARKAESAYKRAHG